jgi:plastocyanin
MPQSRTLVSSCLALALVLAGAGQGLAVLSDSDATAGPARPAAADQGRTAPAGSAANPVRAKAAARGGYLPARLVVRPRQKVWFVSVDRLVHTATAYKRVAGKPVFDNPPSAGVFTIRAPKAAGTYPYFCLVHPYQKGVLVVRPPAAA